MEILNVGIAGIGNIGTAHANSIFENKINGLRLAAVCDMSEKRRDYCGEHFNNTTVYSDYGDMLCKEKLDAVIIATPHKFHSDMAVTALNKGLNVLVEKPVDITVSKAEELNRTAERSEKVFSVMFNQRTNPVYIKAREIVKSGGSGSLKRTDWIITNWYRTQDYYDSGSWRATWSGEGGGVLLNQAPHNLDLWQWICGMPVEITAFCDIAKYHNIEVEDDVTIFARYKNGATGTFITSTGEYPGTNRLEITGDKGKLVIENGVLKWWKLPVSERDICFDKSPGIDESAIEYSEYIPESQGEAHIGILQNFANAILKGEELISPGFDGINELTISNAAYLSGWKGNVPIHLPINADEFDRFLNERIKAAGRSGKSTNTSVSGEYLKRWNVNW